MAAMYACTGASPSPFGICGFPPERRAGWAAVFSTTAGDFFDTFFTIACTPNGRRLRRGDRPYRATPSGIRGGARASEERGGKLVAVVRPPLAPAIVPLPATGAVPHRDGTRVTGADSAPDRCFDAVDRIIDRGEQLPPTVRVQSAGGGDPPQPCRPG